MDKEILRALSVLLDEKLNPIKEDISGVKKDVSSLREDVSELKNNVSSLKEDVKYIKIQQEEHSKILRVLEDKL